MKYTQSDLTNHLNACHYFEKFRWISGLMGNAMRNVEFRELASLKATVHERPLKLLNLNVIFHRNNTCFYIPEQISIY